MNLKELLHNKKARFEQVNRKISSTVASYIEYMVIPKTDAEIVIFNGIYYVRLKNTGNKKFVWKLVGDSNQLTKNNGVLQGFEVEGAYYFMGEKGLYRSATNWGQVGSCIFEIDSKNEGWITGYCEFENFKDIDFFFKNESYEETGLFLKNTRENLGLTLESVSERSGISANTLKRIEDGRFKWDIDLHIKICNALHLKISYNAVS